MATLYTDFAAYRALLTGTGSVLCERETARRVVGNDHSPCGFQGRFQRPRRLDGTCRAALAGAEIPPAFTARIRKNRADVMMVVRVVSAGSDATAVN